MRAVDRAFSLLATLIKPISLASSQKLPKLSQCIKIITGCIITRLQKSKIRSIVASLSGWFAKTARDLPWRRTRDPYAIWVSEVMLQQTQVKTVLGYWERWMEALPDVRALAAARAEKLHKLWEGLGYYSRVRNMQKAARLIVEKHGSVLPRNFEEVLALPGVGRYTAGAICSIAFNQPTPVLDGNVMRVLARVFGVEGNPRERRVNERLWGLAEELVKGAMRRSRRWDRSDASGRTNRCRCGDLNQALMELGALVCTARQPQCAVCPLAARCTALRQERVAELPVPMARPRTTRRRFVAVVLERQGKFLVRRRPAGTVNAQLWEFPNVEVQLSGSGLDRAARLVAGNGAVKLAPLCTINHSITRYRIRLEVCRLTERGFNMGGAIELNELYELIKLNGKFARPAKKSMDRITVEADAPLNPPYRRNPRLRTLDRKQDQKSKSHVRHSEAGRWLRLSQLRRLPFASAHKRILEAISSNNGTPHGGD